MIIIKLIRKLNSFFSLSFLEKFLLIQAIFLLPLIHLSLKLKGVKYTEKILTDLASKTKIKNQDITLVFMTAKMVKIASKYQSWATCLRRSLVLWYLLKKQGFDSKLCIGVRKEKGDFEAHAWVEFQGIPLNENDHLKEMFVTFETTNKVSLSS